MKIALLFLTYGNLSQPKLWRKIINNNKDKLNVYIHNKNKFRDNTYKLHEYCIKNRVNTKYGHKSLVEAVITLLKEASIDEVCFLKNTLKSQDGQTRLLFKSSEKKGLAL